LQIVRFRETVKLTEQQAVLVQRGYVEFPRFCVSDEFHMSFLDGDLFFLRDYAPVFCFPLSNEILRSLPIAEFQRLSQFLSRKSAVNSNWALAVSVLSALHALFAALAVTAVNGQHR
jgi:hypothetical protein